MHTTKKKSFEEVKSIVENKGFTLISKEYINLNTKLDILCPKHGEIKMSLRWFQKGHGCQKCSRIATSQKLSLSLKKIYEISEKIGMKFISYDRENKTFLMECEKHGIIEKTYETFIARRKCYKCGRESYSNKRKIKIEDLRIAVEKQGLTLLSTDFKNQKSKILIKCEKHGEMLKNVQTTMGGHGCIKCAQEFRGNKRRRTLNEIHSFVRSKGYEPLFDDYKTTSQKIKVLCPIHGEFMTTTGILQRGHGCQKCGRTYSKTQGEISTFIKSFDLEIQENDRAQIPPLELDIFIPSMNLAIEYCGLRWHSEEFGKDRTYHYDKMKKCQEKGIRLITIFEDEWLDRQEQVKNYITSVLNKNRITVYARKTEIKEVPKKEAVSFLNENHIQGSTVFAVAFGLYHENNLIGIITGNKHHRQGHGDIFVLNRLAFKHDYNIPGGSSRLVKKLSEYVKINNYSKLISWSDNRWSEGNVYEKLGFMLTEELGPDYSYVFKQERVSKQSCQKKHLVKKGAVGNTELEMSKSLGYSRIWDCGKKRWELP